MFVPKNLDLVAEKIIATAMASTINGPDINVNLYQDFSFYAKWTGTLITSSWNTATTNHILAFNGALVDTSQTITLEGYSITYVEG